MCDIWKTDEHREFSLAQLESQMDAIERLQVRWVVFTGGEPLMHSDLFALSEAAARARHSSDITFDRASLRALRPGNRRAH